MANAKKFTLTTPEATADATNYKLMTVSSIDFSTGEVEGTYCKCDSGDNMLGSGRFKCTMSAADLETIENLVLVQADADSQFPAGTVGDV